MAGGHPPYSLAALARVREMTAIGSSGSRGMTDEIRCGEGDVAGISIPSVMPMGARRVKWSFSPGV